MLIAALFIIAKIWKQPQCPLMDEWIKLYNEILLSHKKEWNPAICDHMDWPLGHYVKWNKSDIKIWILNNLSYIWNITPLPKNPIS